MGNTTKTPVQQMIEEIKDDMVDAEKKAEHVLERKEAQKRVQKMHEKQEKELNQLEEELLALEKEKEVKAINATNATNATNTTKAKAPRHFLFDHIDKYRKKILEKNQRE